MGASSMRLSSSIPSAIAGGASKAFRCWWRSSRPTSPAAFRRSRRALSSTWRSTVDASPRRRCTHSSICSSSSLPDIVMRQAFLLFLALSLAAVAAASEDKFQRKSGLWEVKRTSTLAEGKIRVMQLCIDKASDDALRQLPAGPGDRCKLDKVRREGNKLLVDAVCDISHTRTTAK